MLLPKQFEELNRLGLQLYDHVTVAYLEEQFDWIGWWEYTQPPFDLLWDFLPGAFGYKQPLSPQALIIEPDPGTRTGPGSVFRYRFNKLEHEHEFVNWWARLRMGTAREIVEVFNSLDDGRSFYVNEFAFYYLIDSEVANSAAMKSSKAPKLHRLED